MSLFPGTGYLSSSHGSSSSSRSRWKKWEKMAMKSYGLPQNLGLAKLGNLPLRIRPFFLLLSCFIMLLLALFGFTDISRSIPINHKILHFLCLGVSTAVMYWVVDVDEDVRRVWIWRNAALLITGTLSIVLGSVVSEIVRSFLPYKEFQLANVAANLAGSILGLSISYNIERYQRRRREVSRLYRPLNASTENLSDSEEEEGLLPTQQPSKLGAGQIRLGNVWDETDESPSGGIFAIGDDELASARTPNFNVGSPWMSSGKPIAKGGMNANLSANASPMTGPSLGPKIVVTAPSTGSMHPSPA